MSRFPQVSADVSQSRWGKLSRSAVVNWTIIPLLIGIGSAIYEPQVENADIYQVSSIKPVIRIKGKIGIKGLKSKTLTISSGNTHTPVVCNTLRKSYLCITTAISLPREVDIGIVNYKNLNLIVDVKDEYGNIVVSRSKRMSEIKRHSEILAKSDWKYWAFSGMIIGLLISLIRQIFYLRPIKLKEQSRER